MAADPADGWPGDSAESAVARDAGSRPARAHRLYFLGFLACCLILCCCILTISVFVADNASSNSTSAAWIGGTIAVALVASLCGTIVFLVAFVKTLSQRRRRRVRQVVWPLVPIVSFSLLAWWPFLVLALIRRRAQDWAVFAAYLTAVAAEIVVVILSAQGIIPAGAQIIVFFTTVLLVAVTAAIHTLVAFRPAAGLPSLRGAQQARAAGRQQPLMDASGMIPAGHFARSAMIFITVVSCGTVIALPAYFHWARLPIRAVAVYLVVVTAALIWGCSRSWRMTLQINDHGVTVGNFFRTRRIDWQKVSGFGSDPDMEGISTLNVMLHDGRTITATATMNKNASPAILAAIRQEAERHGIPADQSNPRSVNARRRPRPKWQKWYLLWWLAIVLALLIMGGSDGLV
jgi:hypothetical protein